MQIHFECAATRVLEIHLDFHMLQRDNFAPRCPTNVTGIEYQMLLIISMEVDGAATENTYVHCYIYLQYVFCIK